MGDLFTDPDPVPHRILRASAGAGKTYVLTTQVLSLLQRGIPPDAILATTFTRQAAAEILSRVLTQLARAARSDHEAARLAKELESPALGRGDCLRLLRRVCDSLDRLSISTLDSFFHRLTGAFRLELGMPPRFILAPADDPQVVEIRRQALEALLEELVEQDLEGLLELLRQLHHGTAHRAVVRDLDGLFADLYEVYRREPRAEVWSRLATSPKLAPGELEECLEALRRLRDDPLPRALLRAVEADLVTAEKGDWATFLDRGLAAKLRADPPERRFRSQKIPGRALAVYRPLIAHARSTLLRRVAAQTRSTHGLLELYDRHYSRLRRHERLLLFTDLPQSLLRHRSGSGEELLLELYYRLDARIGHLLLDEFQDTSLEQWQILEPLVEEIRAHGDGSRSFFCVGDPKQGIYGWRGGCPELFEAVERGLDLPATEVLNTSYRSSQVVLDVVNRVFTSLPENPVLSEHAPAVGVWMENFDSHRAYRVSPGCVELVATPSPLPPSTVDEWVTGGGELSEQAATGLEVTQDGGREGRPKTEVDGHEDFVARAVVSLWGRTCRAQVPHGEARKPSLGILVETNRRVQQMLDLLRRLGLEASGEGGDPISGDPAVALVLSALRLADHPGHSAAAFHLTHSPLGSWLGLGSEEAREAARVSFEIRRDLASRGYARSLSAWARALSPFCDRRSAIRLTQLIELAEVYEPRSGLRPGDFVTYVEDTAVAEPSPSPVRVMTIHKSKGLEFDAVVLPDLDRRLLRIEDLLLYAQRSSPTGPIEAVYRAAPARVRRLSPELEGAYSQERARRLRDDLSALYVAMTRARSALYMFLRPLEAKEQGGSRRAPFSYGSLLRFALGAGAGEEVAASAQTLYRAGDRRWYAVGGAGS